MFVRGVPSSSYSVRQFLLVNTDRPRNGPTGELFGTAVPPFSLFHCVSLAGWFILSVASPAPSNHARVWAEAR